MNMRRAEFSKLALVIMLCLIAASLWPGRAQDSYGAEPMGFAIRSEQAIFAGGCFWCLQPAFDRVEGVLATRVGYTGGSLPNPTYEQVVSGGSGHLEAILVEFNPEIVTYRALVDEFWRNIDPTDDGGQFADRGPQYRTAVFVNSEAQRQSAAESLRKLSESKKFAKPIVTAILEASDFYPAEDYHQAYYKKNPRHYQAYSVGSGRKGYLDETWRAE